MWCIPEITEEFIARMEHLCNLYAQPYNPKEPVICFDEKSKQLIADTRNPIPAQAGRPAKSDYEYQRNGTRNIFLAIEPLGGWREATATKRRTKKDFAKEIYRIVNLARYKDADHINLVMDNLNTHFESSFIETFGEEKTKEILKKLVFHYTPKHASWLDMAEIELSILSRQALGGKIPTEANLKSRLRHWQKQRNAKKSKINWKFTVKDARSVFKYKVQN